MQALTQTVFPCYAPADREVAARVAAFLEGGADVRVFLDEGELKPDEDLIGKAREGRMADIVLVLFSRTSLPPRWPRAAWEDALLLEPQKENVRVAFVRCDDCLPPRVLTPQFDLSVRSTEGMRRLKRWIRTGAQSTSTASDRPDLAAEVELIGLAIADRPGVQTVESADLASEFVARFYEDFDEVVQMRCGGRSLTALAGELASRLEMRLEGDLDSNLERLSQECSARRLLVCLEDAAAAPVHELTFGGRCSMLVSTERSTVRDSDPLVAAQMALQHLEGDWAELCSQARLGRRLTMEQGRLSECFELMLQWHDAAEGNGDRRVLDESAREMVWILESWGQHDQARRMERRRALEFDDQMGLPF